MMVEAVHNSAHPEDLSPHQLSSLSLQVAQWDDSNTQGTTGLPNELPGGHRVSTPPSFEQTMIDLHEQDPMQAQSFYEHYLLEL